MAFSDFYRAEFAAIALIAGTTAGSRADGEDLAQEAFARAEARWDDVGTYDRPGAWVRRVAINLALNRRRRLGREAAALLRIGAPNAHVDDDRLGDPDVWRAIGALPPRQRAVVVLHYFEDRSVNDIADLLDCSVSATTSNLSRARRNLAASLEGGTR